MQTIIYVMRHIDIGGHIDIPYKKVGITGDGNATLNSRLQQISNTKSPIKAQCIAAWQYSDARAVESALHSLMEDSRVEGEWFFDKEDTLVERMQPIMELIGATSIEIEESDDAYTKGVIEKESSSKQTQDHILLGKISEHLENPMRSSSRKIGPTFFSDRKKLTYYVTARKSDRHNLHIGRSKNIYNELSKFLENRGYDVVQGRKGGVVALGISLELIAEIINAVEADFQPT